MEKLVEIVSVVTVQTILRTYPYKARHILTDSLEAVIGYLAH